MQSREGDLREFFAHEIQAFPPSLSDLGKPYLPGTKSEILNCIEQPEVPAPPSMYDCTVVDGAVIVHILSTKAVSTFSEYRIAGIFRGVKSSWFSWLSSEPRNIYPRMIS